MKPTPKQLKALHHILISTGAPLSECLTLVIDHWEVIRDTPEPLAFPDPPHGWEWHNPEKLTPELIGITDGWRLLVQGEPRPVDVFFWDTRWVMSAIHSDCNISSLYTYRTKAPLPAPKPTAEELEKAEFLAWWKSTEYWASDDKILARQAWKAAKKGIPTP